MAGRLKTPARRVDAYRRFCFLAVVSPTPVTPSEIVDEVWHQHLIYSRDYWTIWCGEKLRAPLHHDPTPGGPEAQMIYRRQYAETLALHERFFGPPNQELWPATHLRFAAPRYQVTDRGRWFIIPKPIAWIHRLLEEMNDDMESVRLDRRSLPFPLCHASRSCLVCWAFASDRGSARPCKSGIN